MILALVFPAGDVGELIVVTEGFTLGGLVLEAEVTTAALLTVVCVTSHELSDLDEVC